MNTHTAYVPDGGGGLVAQSCPTLVTPWTVAYQVPPSMGFSRQAYWSGLPFSSPGHLPNPGIEPGSLALQSDSLPSEPPKNHSLLLSVVKTASAGKTLTETLLSPSPRQNSVLDV